MTTPELAGPDPSQTPIKVVEVVVAAYQWDAWRHAALKGRRFASTWSIIAGVIVGIAAAWAGVVYLPGAAKFSVILYAPLIAWPVASFVRSLIAERKLARVLDDVRPMLVPALVPRLDDASLLKLLIVGGALLTRLCTTLAVERRDAAVAVIASEYDLRFSEYLDFGSSGGG